jgi:hypothetical protein
LPVGPPTVNPGSQPVGANIGARVPVISQFSVDSSHRLHWSCEDDYGCYSAYYNAPDDFRAAMPAPPLPSETSARPYTYEIYKKSASDSNFSLLATTNTVVVYCTQSHVEYDSSAGANCAGDLVTTSYTVCDATGIEWDGILASAVATPTTFRIIRRDPNGKLLATQADFYVGPGLSPK